MADVYFFLPAIAAGLVLLLAWYWVEKPHAELDKALRTMLAELEELNRGHARPMPASPTEGPSSAP